MSENKTRHSGRDRGYTHRLKRMREHGLKPRIAAGDDDSDSVKSGFALDCGWGRLVFGQTFEDAGSLVTALRDEQPDQRDIAVYIRNPHVLLAEAPQEVFLDPSHTYRLDLASYRPSKRQPKGFFVRRLTSRRDAEQINRLYASRGMVEVPADFFWDRRDARSITYFVVEDETSGEILGTVTGVDHSRAFNDPEKGASLWCLAVDPQARHPGVGEALTRRLAEYFSARSAAYMDLSVLHDNKQAIRLYEKLGFHRVAFFAAKRKNPINENLFTGHDDNEDLNPYAKIITREARRRGIHVEVTDMEGGLFRLSHGGRSIHCRESLSELTSSVAMSICDDKSVTRRFVMRAGVKVPEQIAGDCPKSTLQDFISRHGEVVVKPARGEQGRGISIALSDPQEVENAIGEAREVCDSVLIEEYVKGADLRIVVINYEVVAAAIRKPPSIVGDGAHTVAELIGAQSRRREAATGGESSIPVDAETLRTIRRKGHDLKTVLDPGEELQVRKTANLHTGGTIHDVTGRLHPELAEAAIAAARAISIPVAGIDLMVEAPDRPEYRFIECNERPGLANHEPQPTAEKFIDLLFPLTRPVSARKSNAAKDVQKENAEEP